MLRLVYYKQDGKIVLANLRKDDGSINKWAKSRLFRNIPCTVEQITHNDPETIFEIMKHEEPLSEITTDSVPDLKVLY